MNQDFQVQVRDKMMKAIKILEEDLATIRTGRATPALVENLDISAYNNTTHLKLKEMATITTDGARMLVIAPFDPSVIRDIERGISSANLGFTGAVDGSIIRISIPPLTDERRQQYIKLCHAKVEGGRVMVRQVRHEFMADLKRQFEAKEIGEDDKKSLEKVLQTATDEMISEIDVFRERKETELSQI